MNTDTPNLKAVEPDLGDAASTNEKQLHPSTSNALNATESFTVAPSSCSVLHVVNEKQNQQVYPTQTPILHLTISLPGSYQLNRKEWLAPLNSQVCLQFFVLIDRQCDFVAIWLLDDALNTKSNSPRKLLRCQAS